MSLIHKSSGECPRPELNLFTTPPTQTSILRVCYRDYHPLTSLDRGGPIQFRVISGDTDFIDLRHAVLYLKMKIVKTNGDDITAPSSGSTPEDQTIVYPICYIHATQFKNIEVAVNGRQIGVSETMYPYKAYLEALLSHGNEAKDHTLAAGMFYQDTGDFDERDVASTTPAAGEGAKTRFTKTKYSRAFETIGQIHHELFTQDKLLPNNTEIRIVLHRADNAFSLICKSNSHTNYKIEISDAQLKVPHCEISPHVLEALTSQLQTKPYLYEIKRTRVRWYSRNSGTSDLSEANLINGIIPRRIILGIVKSSAFSGSFQNTPFNFQNFKVSSVVLRVDGLTVPFQCLSMDYDDNCYMQGYLSLLQCMDILYKDAGIKITPKSYPDGMCLYAFDLGLAKCSSLNLIHEGTVSVEIKCAENTSTSVTVITYCETDDILELDKTGVMTDD